MTVHVMYCECHHVVVPVGETVYHPVAEQHRRA